MDVSKDRTSRQDFAGRRERPKRDSVAAPLLGCARRFGRAARRHGLRGKTSFRGESGGSVCVCRKRRRASGSRSTTRVVRHAYLPHESSPRARSAPLRDFVSGRAESGACEARVGGADAGLMVRVAPRPCGQVFAEGPAPRKTLNITSSTPRTTQGCTQEAGGGSQNYWHFFFFFSTQRACTHESLWIIDY